MKERKYNFSSFEGRGVVPGMEHVYIFNLSLFKKEKKSTQSQSKHRKKFHYDCFLTGFFWLRLPISSCCYTSSADYQSLWYLRFPKKPQQEKSAKSAWNFLRSRCFCKLTVYCCFSGSLVTVT